MNFPLSKILNLAAVLGRWALVLLYFMACCGLFLAALGLVFVSIVTIVEFVVYSQSPIWAGVLGGMLALLCGCGRECNSPTPKQDPAEAKREAWCTHCRKTR